MQKIIIISLLCLSALGTLSAQKFFTREGHISFFSEAALENIEAHNRTATSVIDSETGRMEFAVLIKGFQFEKALMQEHFNENYLESDQFPKATFKGQLTDAGAVNWSRNGTYPVNVAGFLNIHGVTQEITIPASITVADGSVKGEATFMVTVADYDIEIPSVVREKIAEQIEVTVNMDYQPFNN
ncbi:MAG: YceI family protein [Lewinella sp.]|nr:YceI family protein [Lewinella sp.]